MSKNKTLNTINDTNIKTEAKNETLYVQKLLTRVNESIFKIEYLLINFIFFYITSLAQMKVTFRWIQLTI